MKHLYWLASISFCVLAVAPVASSQSARPFGASTIDSGWSVFPVDFTVEQHPVTAAVLVRGHKNKGQDIEFKNWLLPLDTVIETLSLEVTVLNDGDWQVRSPLQTIRLNPKERQMDLNLGIVVSIQEIETLLGVPASFDPNLQTIQFAPPWLEHTASQAEESISPEVLPRIKAPDFNITAIRQQTNIRTPRNASPSKTLSYTGELAAIGTLLGGSWFIETNQPDLTNDHTWRLQEAQYLRQTESADFVLGSQPSFWSGQGHDYWGLTTVRRWGFAPPQQSEANGFKPDQRLQARPTEGANLTPGQLPTGASALTISGGTEREFAVDNTDLLGKLQGFQGGVSYRYGVSEDVTLGTGFVYEDSIRGLGELFYSPSQSVQFRVSALGDPNAGVDINSQIRLPSLTFDLNYDRDLDLSQFKLDWKLGSGFSFAANGNSLDDLTPGVRYSYKSPDFFTSIRADLDSDSNLLWQFNSQWGRFNLSSGQQKFTSNSELSVNVAGEGSWGHFLRFNYKTRDNNEFEDDLAILGWRYRSQEQLANQRLWEFEVSYGMGSQGDGLITSVATGIVPGLGLQVGYEDISVASHEPSFTLKLVPNFSSSRANDSRIERLRQQGSLLIQPFFDSDRNGKRDVGERLYTDKPDVLLLNHKPLKDYQPDIQDGMLLKLFPATYRLEIDETQLPADWTTEQSAWEVEVVAGGNTSVLIPFQKRTEDWRR